MKKQIYLKTLRKELAGLPKEEIDDIIEDYKEHFETGLKKRRKEESIAKGLGKPKQVAKQLKAEYHVKIAQETKKIKHVGKAIFATVSLGLFNLIIVLGPLIGLFAVIISLYAVVLSLGVSGVASFVAGVLLIIAGSATFGLGVFFAGIALIAFTILFVEVVNLVTKYFFKGVIAYLKLNVRIIKGEEK